MKRLFFTAVWSLAVLLVSAAALTALFWSKRTSWPDFPAQNAGPAPQVVVKVEPDFSWRTGDRIPVTIYVKQPPQVTVDLSSLAIEGDFELAGAPAVYSREQKDGSKLLRIDLTVQSFAVQPKWAMTATMSYLVSSDPLPKVVNLPAVTLYTSRTYDGRPDRQNGPMTVEHGWHYWTTGLALAGGLLGAIAAWMWHASLKKRKKEELEAPLIGRALARFDFEPVWERIASGKDTPADYQQIAGIIRRLYRIYSRVTWEIPMELGDNHPHLKQILHILKLCDRVMYKGAPLTPAEKAQIRQLFDEITLLKKPQTVNAAPATVAGKSD